MRSGNTDIAAGIGLAAALLLTYMVPAHGAEKTVKASDVPPAVHDAVKTRYPDARAVRYVREAEHGKVTYEVTIKADRRTIDVGLTPEGRVVAEEEQITREDLPPAVARALVDSHYGRSELRRVERIIEGDRRDEPRFEILVRDGAAFVELTFDRHGALTKQERTRKP